MFGIHPTTSFWIPIPSWTKYPGLLGGGGVMTGRWWGHLKDLPVTAKWLITLVLISFALNHLASTALVWEVTRHVDSTAKEHFAYKTLAQLLRMTHQHVFGHGAMYFITSGIFLLAGWPTKITLLLITLPFVGAWLDNGSWFLLKYSSDRWEILSAIGGLMYAISFAVMFFVTLRQMWFEGKRPN